MNAYARVGRFYLSTAISRGGMEATIGDHTRLLADRRFSCSVDALVGNPPEWLEMSFWKQILKPGKLFVDVGANVGTYSLWAADLGCDVIAVEPMADSRQALIANATLNDYDFEVVAAALSDKAGSMRITSRFATMNHLLSEGTTSGIEVDVRTLDEVLGDRVAHGVKIDVEGAERLVLSGAPRALAEGRLPIMQIEWNGMSQRIFGESRQPLAELLGDYGYRFYRPDSRGVLQSVGTEQRKGNIFAILPGAEPAP